MLGRKLWNVNRSPESSFRGAINGHVTRIDLLRLLRTSSECSAGMVQLEFASSPIPTPKGADLRIVGKANIREGRLGPYRPPSSVTALPRPVKTVSRCFSL